METVSVLLAVIAGLLFLILLNTSSISKRLKEPGWVWIPGNQATTIQSVPVFLTRRISRLVLNVYSPSHTLSPARALTTSE